MMELEYYITGGYIKIHKNAFIQEMLSKDSCLRKILNWKTDKDYTTTHPDVGEPDENGMVIINFNFTGHVKLDDTSEKLLSDLKARYKERVKGMVTCRATIFYSMYHIYIDMNSDDDKIKRVQS